MPLVFLIFVFECFDLNILDTFSAFFIKVINIIKCFIRDRSKTCINYSVKVQLLTYPVITLNPKP